MSVMRVNKDKNFTVMSNYHFREKEMTLKAKGLLSLMLSLPDTWDYSIAGLVSICKENETAVRSTLKELEKFGYLRITKLLPNETKSGRIEYIYDIYEKPQYAENQDIEKQGIENLDVECLDVDNQGQLNTNQSNTYELNTYKSNKDIYSPSDAGQCIECASIIEYLNQKAGTRYRTSTPKTQRLIKARVKEGFTLQDFKDVIDKKVREWLNTDYERYLRPETLFGTKFEGYLNQKSKMTTKDLASAIDWSDF